MDNEKVEKFFKELLSQQVEINEEQQLHMNHAMDNLPQIQYLQHLLLRFTMDECREAIWLTKKGKAPDVTGVTAEAIQQLDEEAVKIVHDIINAWAWGQINLEFLKKARTKLIFKSGDPNEVSNYRPITVLDILHKIMANITLRRLQHLQGEMFSPEQAGFREGRNTTQNVLYLKALKEYAQKTHQDLFVLFVDLRKAFDTVHRPTIYMALEAMGFPEQWVAWIKKLSDGIVTQVAAGTNQYRLG